MLLKKIAKESEYKFIKNVYPSINTKKITKNGEEFKFKLNEEVELKSSIHNSEDIMAKNVEFRLPISYDFLINDFGNFSSYSGSDEIILQYKQQSIQGRTNLLLEPIKMSTMKKGKYKIRIFIKGENILAKYYEIIFIVE